MTDERPLCKCHGEPMLWQGPKNPRWKCNVKAKRHKERWRWSESGYRSHVKEEKRRRAINIARKKAQLESLYEKR